MTVPYLHHLHSSGFGFYRILFKWCGSIYKGVWRQVLLYCSLYALVSLLYRHVLFHNERSKEFFERFCIYAGKVEHGLPLNFLLGFYVTQVRLVRSRR